MLARMLRATTASVLAAVVALAPSVRADIAPSPEEDNRFIERRIVVDRRGVPTDVPLKYSARSNERRGFPTRLEERLPPDVYAVSVYSGKEALGSERIWGPDLELPPHQEVAVAVDRRVRVERHFRLQLVEQQGRKHIHTEPLEDVFYDRAGAVVCRRPPLPDNDIEFDPCDPTTAGRERAYHFKLAAAGGATTFAFAAALFAWRRRRRARKDAG